MKTKNMYLNRLLKLSETLLTLDSQKKYKAGENGISVEHFYWALDLVSDKLKSNESDNNILSGFRRNEILYKAAAYFSLTVDEVFAIFVPGYQEEFLGGQLLSRTAGPAQLAQNIIRFVEIKEAERCDQHNCHQTQRKEKQYRVLTFKKYTHEENKYQYQLS